jgi:membrane protein
VTAARHAERWENTALGQLWSRLLEMEFVDRSIALAAKAFVSFFPFLIVVTALTPDNVRDEVLIDVSGRFGISGNAYGTLQQAFTSADETRAATGVIGALIAVAFAISFTTALQRVYLRAWRRPAGGGARNRGRGVAWMGGIVALMLVLTFARDVLRIPTGPALVWAIGLVMATGVWWWTAHLMLRGDVRWRALIPTGLVTGVGCWLYTLAASVWMPATVTKQFAQFGAFGIALALVTWFTGLALLVTVAAVLGRALAEGDGTLGRWLRSGRTTALADGAAAPLPGPDRPVRLSDAFGRGSRGSGVPQAHDPDEG